MRYIALEEAFFIPELADLLPAHRQLMQLLRPDVGERYERRLPDFTEYRLAEMDDAGIDIQALSLTSPGLQVELDAERARDNARFANDHLAKIVARHPDRFRGFAALPLQDPAAGARDARPRRTWAPTSSSPTAGCSRRRSCWARCSRSAPTR